MPTQIPALGTVQYFLRGVGGGGWELGLGSQKKKTNRARGAVGEKKVATKESGNKIH